MRDTRGSGLWSCDQTMDEGDTTMVTYIVPTAGDRIHADMTERTNIIKDQTGIRKCKLYIPILCICMLFSVNNLFRFYVTALARRDRVLILFVYMYIGSYVFDLINFIVYSLC